MENLSRAFKKKKKKIHEVIEFKIEFLLQFTGCSKLLEKNACCPHHGWWQRKCVISRCSKTLNFRAYFV